MLIPPTKALKAIIKDAWEGDASAEELVAALQEEQDLLTTILRFANARQHMSGREIEDPLRAALLLGTTVFGHLTLVFTLCRALSGAKAELQEITMLREDCVRRAAAARLIAQRFGATHPDMAFAVGLVLEFGRVPLMEKQNNKAKEFRVIRNLCGDGRLHAEQKIFEKDHMAAFAETTFNWGLPEDILEAVANHHLPFEAIRGLDNWRLTAIARWSDTVSEVYTADDPEAALERAVKILTSEAYMNEKEAKNLVSQLSAETEKSAKLLGVELSPGRTLEDLVRLAQGEYRPETMERTELLAYVNLLNGEKAALEEELRSLRSELHTLMQFDSLTGLPNRRRYLTSLRKEMGRARRYGRPMALVVVDLDGFTEINARYGQKLGDNLLSKVGRILHRVVRDVDILARIGADEFAVILPETGPTGGRILAERVRASLEDLREEADSQRVVATASVIGLSLSDLSGTADHDALHGVAMKELFRLRKRGGNRVSWYTPRQRTPPKRN